MNDTSSTKTKLRYRAYFWLMNICLFFGFFGLIDYIVSPYDKPEDAPTVYLIFAIVTLFFNFLVPLFLVFSGFMRDDYAEGLWKRSLAVMGYCAAIGPLFLFLGAWVAYFIALKITHPEAPLDGSIALDAPDYIDWFFKPEVSPRTVLMWMWQIFLLLFVAIFQFLRWRDSR